MNNLSVKTIIGIDTGNYTSLDIANKLYNGEWLIAYSWGIDGDC